jgi:hypothetical protein
LATAAAPLPAAERLLPFLEFAPTVRAVLGFFFMARLDVATKL